MKTQKRIARIFVLFMCLILCVTITYAENGYTTISGTVKDKSNNKNLEHVTVSIPGTNIGTVTNEDGVFILKVNDSIRVSYIEFSHIGYKNSRISYSGDNMLNQTFYMTFNPLKLKEVIVHPKDPVWILEQAFEQVEHNYPTSPNLLTSFYRETVKKRQSYIEISEAVTNIYKTSYNRNINQDKVQILKGRTLLSPNKRDTLAIKLIGGPNLSIFGDFLKNPEILFGKDELHHYKFTMETPTVIDNRMQYVISFEPQVTMPYPLYFGTFYIDQEKLAFVRAEFSMDMKDKEKVTSIILQKKPSGLNFKPEGASFVVTYKQQGDKYRLNYIRNELKFKCDWKKWLFFAANYTVTSEMVITDSHQEVQSISRNESFNRKESLSDKVSAFYDSDFWGSYNIIEPTESLESAVNKLIKKHPVTPTR